MVVAGATLLFSTSRLILEHDKLGKGAGFDAAAQKWRESGFDLEYSYDGGFEIERPIGPDELPASLGPKYQELSSTYDHVLLEKVFRFGKEPAYEFYCYKDDQLTKFDLE